MTDREKVLELVESIIVHAEDERTNRSWESDDIGWKNIDKIWGCSQRLKELLKEQEAENGDWITIWQEDYTSISARCSICNRISERPLGGYCKWCGAKMNQEWGVDG